MTSRFANVPFANALCRFAKKQNERCACICFVLSAMIQKSAIRMCIPRYQAKAVGELTQHVRETIQKLANRRLAKRLVGEPTVNPTKHTEGACMWLTSALIGKLSELRHNLKLMCVIKCFFISTLGRQFLYHYLPSVSYYFIVISLQACNGPQQTPACQTHL